MNVIAKKIYWVCFLVALSTNLIAEEFLVSDIRLEGANRVRLATVLSSLPIKKGDTVDANNLKVVLTEIYASGLFNDVQLFKEGNTLIISVDERPAIAEVNFDGNQKLEDEMLTQAFDSAGLVAGRIYNANVLNAIQKELENVYYSLGRYGVKMVANVVDLPRNRVKIDIDIQEGRQAKIRHINIVGNKKFSDKKILKELKSGIPSWWALFSSKDQYEKSKLNGDLEAINAFYLDRGYVDFKLESTQVSISNNKKDIFVAVNVNEGEIYTINNIQAAGDLILPDSIYKHIISDHIVMGDVFSRKQVTKVMSQIQQKLGVVGYPFATVRPLTDIHSESREVDIVFTVDPKQKTYINRIDFVGNEKTMDKVYRRELRQMEGALYNTELVERSRVRIQRLEYVENVSVQKVPVPGKSDAINLVYTISERLAGSFNAGLGLSDNGTSFNFGITQSNVFGTGNALALNLSKSDTTTSYGLTYRNPYYKTDNMSRSLRFNYRTFDATDEAISTEYLLDTLGIGATYGMPLSEYSRLSYGFTLGFNDVLPTNLDASNQSPVLQIQNFIDTYGQKNDFLRLSLSYSIDRRDRRIFAKKGSLNRFNLDWTTPASDLSYYKFSYIGEKYFAMDSGSLLLRAQVRYGKGLDGLDGLPFYEKYLAGGIRSLRGFESRSIGPFEVRTDALTPDPLGGDLSTLGTVEWLFNSESLGASSQFSLFYDFGGVFESSDEFDTSTFRSAYGVAYNWLSPVGPLVFSYAKPVDQEPNDVTERFQFTIGTAF